VDHWIVVHWFELSSLGLLCLNLWFVFTVLNAMREMNRWLAILSRWLDRTQGANGPAER
jgi:hypothetical protein